MGFISTLISKRYAFDLPRWFKDKYSETLFIDKTLISSKAGMKLYGNQLEIDYQLALIQSGFFEKGGEMDVVVLGEDGKVTKVIIKIDRIYYMTIDSDDWYETADIWCPIW